MKQFSDILKSRAGKLKSQNPSSTEGTVYWQSPSNIAIVKYWGKFPGQIPANASLSLTLSKSLTKTRIEYNYDPNRSQTELDFKFDGKENQTFSKRLNTYLENIHLYLPWLAHTNLSIASENTFPHSSGIASSASSMSALALGLCEIDKEIYHTETEINGHRMASFLARLGSGSASRSVYEKMSIWGETSSWKASSDEYAVPFDKIHGDFEIIHDSILIIESGQKEVSSSTGHAMMHSNPYASKRFESAEQNMQRLIPALSKGDWMEFIEIMENEALSLHAMMLTSNPGFILMKPKTLIAINKVREFRRETGINIGFTLDAGANVHIIYCNKDLDAVRTFIEKDLRNICENGIVIHDQMGSGPKSITL